MSKSKQIAVGYVSESIANTFFPTRRFGIAAVEVADSCGTRIDCLLGIMLSESALAFQRH